MRIILMVLSLWWRCGESTCAAAQAASGCKAPPAPCQEPSGSIPDQAQKEIPRHGGVFLFGGDGGNRPALRRRPPRVARRPRRLAKSPRVRFPIKRKKKYPTTAGYFFLAKDCHFNKTGIIVVFYLMNYTK